MRCPSLKHGLNLKVMELQIRVCNRVVKYYGYDKKQLVKILFGDVSGFQVSGFMILIVSCIMFKICTFQINCFFCWCVLTYFIVNLTWKLFVCLNKVSVICCIFWPPFGCCALQNAVKIWLFNVFCAKKLNKGRNSSKKLTQHLAKKGFLSLHQ